MTGVSLLAVSRAELLTCKEAGYLRVVATAQPSRGKRRRLRARLAVDRSLQGRGFGRALVADDAVRTLQAAELVGARGLLVHVRDQTSTAFYERLGFVRSPTDPGHLMVLIKDLRRTFG